MTKGVKQKATPSTYIFRGKGTDWEEKKQWLAKEKKVLNFFAEHPLAATRFSALHVHELVVLYSLIYLGQWDHLFNKGFPEYKALQTLVGQLLPVEEFYQEMGGIIGYHNKCLELYEKKASKECSPYFPPKPVDLSHSTSFVEEMVEEGIKHLEEVAEIYPLGGAADRLMMLRKDQEQFQIASTFSFCQKTLLQRLVEDLQAREFLYFQKYGKQIRIPIVMMTSEEKGGTEQILTILHEENWFGRREEDFFLFSQPLVPAMKETGQWCSKGEGVPLMKPGGHGVIWKLARESGALQWLKARGVRKLLVRQINNPIASVDYGLLAFLGIGFSKDQKIGFAGCPCQKGVSEGINVVVEKEGRRCLTNIEYCDFDQELVNAQASSLLANTNLLFLDICTIEKLIKESPIPGMLVNAKKVKYQIDHHHFAEEKVMRLESTMQNIADGLTESGSPLEPMESVYITTNRREKTISSIKKEFAFGSSMLQTPEQCYLDMLNNGRDLLVNYCHFQVPQLRDSTAFFAHGPSFIFQYHPSLGPTYSAISKKVQGGTLALDSEWILEIADIEVASLSIEGSLHICTDAVMGKANEDGVITYGQKPGSCRLKEVKVRNLGIARDASRSFWKDEIVHQQRCVIEIGPGGEFIAENVTIEGDHHIVVPAGMRVRAVMEQGSLALYSEKK